MISYLGSLVQFSPAAGRAGRCRQISLCVDSTQCAPAPLGLPRTGVSVFSPSTLLRLPSALHGLGPALSVVPVFGSSTKARIRLRLRVVSSPASAVQASRACTLSPRMRRTFSLRGERPRQPEACAPSPRVWRTFSLCSPSARCRSGLSKSLDRNRGRFARWEGVASRGLSLPLSPPPCLLPLAGMGRLFSGLSQSLCFANCRQCVLAGKFVLALPQFKKAPSDCSQGLLASPYSKQCRPLLSVPPPLAGGGCQCLGYFSAGSCF